MGDYRRMGVVEQHLKNATSTTLFHQLSDLWRSPRGTVLRIEALALVAIVLSFFLAAFGSCRRWSNRWIVQKGFMAAQVLSLSLGTYSIGLMQSSSVKSEMYPIWAMSLLTLFGCIDPVTTYIGLDYKGPLLKVIFQLCLYCGYALLLSVPTIPGVVGNLAIGMLSAITFIKGFHRSLALVLPRRTRDQLGGLVSTEPDALAGDGEGLMVHLPVRRVDTFGGRTEAWHTETTMARIRWSCNHMLGEPWLGVTANDMVVIEDVCLGCSLSLMLRRRVLGLDTAREIDEKKMRFESLIRAGRYIDYKRTMKAVEVELAFLYEVLFTSNEFLHYHEARISSFWALASFIWICFVGTVPGTIMAGRRITSTAGGPGAGTVVVDTTTADLIITRVILVSLALVQLAQLVRCWTSNWARVAFACEYAAAQPKRRKVDVWSSPGGGAIRYYQETDVVEYPESSSSWWPLVRLRAFVVTRMNWFDRYLWQDKLGQYSLHDADKRKISIQGCCAFVIGLGFICCGLPGCARLSAFLCCRLPRMLGLQYIGQVMRELWGTDTSTEAPVGLHDEVKASIVDLLVETKSTKIGKGWSSRIVGKGLPADLLQHLPYTNAPLPMSDAYAFAHRVIMWHTATYYCEQAEQRQGRTSSAGGGVDDDREKNRRVANVLSKYCTYLVVSAPELLPGPAMETRRALDKAWGDGATEMGRRLGERLRNQTSNGGETTVVCSQQSAGGHWKVLALLWAQTLVYAAPYGNVEAHMQHLSQGGEFITHLWALLYHLGIDKWEHEEEEAQAAAGQTREPAAEAHAGESREAEAHTGQSTEAKEIEIEETN